MKLKLAGFSIRLLTMATILTVAVGQLNASIVVNGSFESPSIGTFYQHVPNGSAAISGWGVGYGGLSASSGVDIVNDLFAPAGLTPAADGHQYIDLNGSPGPGNIFQILNTVAGQLYSLTFQYSANGNVQQTGRVGVWDTDVNGTSIVGLTSFAHTNTPPTGLTWQTMAIQFVALGSQTMIGFEQFNPLGGTNGALVDNVVVEAVPEPTAVIVWSLLGASATVFAFGRRRSDD